MPHLRSARLAGWQIWLLGLSGLGLLTTGIVWLVLHYFGQREGPYGPEMNPLEPWMMTLHGFFVIPALLAIGAMLVAHIPKGWTHRPQRPAGIGLCTVLAALSVSGYLIYYAGNETLREWNSVAHWTLGLALPGFAFWHYLYARALRRKGRRK